MEYGGKVNPTLATLDAVQKCSELNINNCVGFISPVGNFNDKYDKVRDGVEILKTVNPELSDLKSVPKIPEYKYENGSIVEVKDE